MTTESLPMTPPGKNFTSTRPPVPALTSAAAERSSRIQAEPSGASVAIFSVCAIAGDATTRASSDADSRRIRRGIFGTPSEIVLAAFLQRLRAFLRQHVGQGIPGRVR